MFKVQMKTHLSLDFYPLVLGYNDNMWQNDRNFSANNMRNKDEKNSFV